MQLRDARLCLDCEEIHAGQVCPVCGSETFAFVSRWVPAPESGRNTRPTSSDEAEVYRELLDEQPKSPPRRLLKRGLLGLTALGIAGWAWRNSRHNGTSESDNA